MSYLFGGSFDPETALVGEITEATDGVSDDGLHEVAKHEKVTLWADVRNGRVVDYRAVDVASQQEVGVARFKPPPKASKSDGPVAQMQPRNGCGYVCAALGDGGYICWWQCSGKDGGR
jgi:hypothetical protein